MTDDKYPKLMESTANPGLVILMVDEETGTVVRDADIPEGGVGSWSDIWEPSVLVPFIGTVELSND